MPNKYRTRKLKDGKIKRIVYNEKNGRIIRWEDADDLQTPNNEYKIFEHVGCFKPTRETAKYTPSSHRNFEVRMRKAYDENDTDQDIEQYLRDALEEITNYEMVETATFDLNKKGSDIIGYSKDKEPKYKIIDTTRPYLKYPKNSGYGTIDQLKPKGVNE